MKAQHAMLGGVGLVIAIGLVWYGMAASSPHANEPLPNRAQISDAPAVQAADATTRVADDVPSQRDNAADPIVELTDVVTQTDDASNAVTMRWIEGRTLDPRGEPIGGVEVSPVQVLVPGEPLIVLAQSDGDGKFRFETTNERLSLYGRLFGYVTVYGAEVGSSTSQQDRLIVLAPAVELAGRVVDSDGVGIEGITLVVATEGPRLVDFPFLLDGNSASFLRVTSGPDGKFALREAPRIDGYRLHAYGAGFQRTSIEVPVTSQYDLLITMERAELAEETQPRIFGVVVLPGGAPASGASVKCGHARTTADDEGRFELATAPFRELYSPVVARLDGWQPAIWQTEAESPEALVQEVGPLYLVLPGEAFSIRGRLELDDGSPAVGWHFSLIEPRQQSELPDLLSPEGKAITDARGAFELDGLGPDEVALRFWTAERPFGAFDSAPIPTGTTGLVLRVPEGLRYASLAGRITFPGGAPVAGAQVDVSFTVNRSPIAGSTRTVTSTTTDADGTFELKNVPSIGARLNVSGDGFAEFVLEPLDGDLGPGPLAIEVQRLVEARIDASSADPLPTSFRLLDARGEDVWLPFTRSLEGGRSGVFRLPESAATLVLLRGDRNDPEELSRHAITLVPGDVNVLTP